MAHRDDTGDEKQPTFLNAEQLAQRWGVTPQHLAELRYLGRGCRYHKLGRLVRYRMEDVLAFERSSQHETVR